LSRVGLLALAAVLALSLATRWTTARHIMAGAVSDAKRKLHDLEPPHIKWATARPEEEGLNPDALGSLRQALAAAGTSSFLVVRGNHVVYEWYGPGSGPNVRHGTAAMAKAVTGTVALLAAANDGDLDIDDLAARFIPSWRADSIRGRIRIRDLASHRSGMDDVDFRLAAEHKLNGWKQFYYDHPAERFRLALDTSPIRYPPGSRVSYSGVGYYALAYALAASLKGTPHPDVETLLRERIMLPLGVPDDDWRLSYGESYQADGMRLYAMGSGASYTARAVARIGELILDHGRWEDRWLLDSSIVRRALEPAPTETPPPGTGLVDPPSSASSGWWLNVWGSWPSAPRDALVGLGNGHQVILVVPSLDLVMVRTGEALSSEPDQFHSALRTQLIDPLMRAVTGPSSRMTAGH
jgi:CubicO group peptidase (beta-lactamase class C family)